jgi:hypothetical protein
MKFVLRKAVLFLLLAAVLCGAVSLFSCDTVFFREFEGRQGEQGDQGEKGQKGDKGPQGGTFVEEPDIEEPEANFSFISLTGERLEKYQLALDPVDPNKTINFSAEGPAVNINYTRVRNSIKINGFPLLNLINTTKASANVTGGVICRVNVTYNPPFFENNEEGQTVSFNETADLTPDGYAISDNEYSVSDSFTAASPSFSLPKTGNYSSKLKFNKDVAISFTVSKELLESFVSMPSPSSHWTWDSEHNSNITVSNYPSEFLGCDLFPSAIINEQHGLKSRNFYEYKSIKVTFPFNISLSAVTSSSIVKTYDFDKQTNSLTVIFNDYNSPYVGDVVSYVSFDNKTKKTTNETIKISN